MDMLTDDQWGQLTPEEKAAAVQAALPAGEAEKVKVTCVPVKGRFDRYVVRRYN